MSRSAVTVSVSTAPTSNLAFMLQPIVDVQGDPLRRIRLEVRQQETDFIVPNRQSDAVLADVVGDRLARLSGIGADNGDFYSGKNTAGLIEEGTQDRPRRFL